MDEVDPGLLALLQCPISGQPLVHERGSLVTPDGGHRYPVVRGIPCLMPDLPPTHAGHLALTAQNACSIANPPEITDDYLVANFTHGMLRATCGNLFRGAPGGTYPIPDFPQASFGAPILEIGCSWGRWSIAAARRGHLVVGLDPHLNGLLCAQRLFDDFEVRPRPLLVLGDARSLPFRDGVFGGLFSYSVVQHFAPQTARAMLSDAARVMRSEALSVVQMPNAAGLRSFERLARRRFSEGGEFDVRYYSLGQLMRMFQETIGPSDWEVDCFLGLNVHATDRPLVPKRRRWIIDLAEALRRVAKSQRWLASHADSVWVRSVRRACPAPISAA